MAGVDSGRRHVGRWVDELDRLTDALRQATDQQVHAGAEERRQMNRYAQIKDDIDEVEEAWQAAERERAEADNEVKSILTAMERIQTEATQRMQLSAPPQGGPAGGPGQQPDEEEAERAEAERLEGEARLALSPVEAYERMRASIERATQGAAA
jgi:hypothetical protein